MDPINLFSLVLLIAVLWWMVGRGKLIEMVSL